MFCFCTVEYAKGKVGISEFQFNLFSYFCVSVKHAECVKRL